jgi:hypothetical protein
VEVRVGWTLEVLNEEEALLAIWKCVVDSLRDGDFAGVSVSGRSFQVVRIA